MRSDREIVEQTNQIAKAMYSHMGYIVPDGHKFYEFERANYHPQEQICWAAACDAQMILTNTDPNDALDNLEDEGLEYSEALEMVLVLVGLGIKWG